VLSPLQHKASFGRLGAFETFLTLIYSFLLKIFASTVPEKTNNRKKRKRPDRLIDVIRNVGIRVVSWTGL